MLGHTSSEFWTRPAAANLEELKQMAVELFGEDAPAFCSYVRLIPAKSNMLCNKHRSA